MRSNLDRIQGVVRLASHSDILGLAGAFAVVLALALATQAQTQATCQFQVFPLDTDSSNTSTSLGGINNFGTVVGSRFFQGGNVRGLIRQSWGAITYYDAPNGTTTRFTDLNDSGTSTGYYFNQNSGRYEGLLLRGMQFTSISKSATLTVVSGVNDWNNAVGYFAVGPYPSFRGFKRYHDAVFVSINYPGALATSPSAINDRGVIVGSYFLPSAQDPFYSQHGFIYHEGHWITLDYPDSTVWTDLEGISNDGVIIGNTISHAGGFQTIQSAFMYVHDDFKLISAPNEPFTQLTGISPRVGLIAGFALDFSGATEGFTATCR